MHEETPVTWGMHEDLKETLNKAAKIIKELRVIYWSLEFFSQLGEELGGGGRKLSKTHCYMQMLTGKK